MKKSILKDTHTGNQPIRVLKHNLTHRLVEIDEELITDLINKNLLQDKIIYNSADLSLLEGQMPCADENGYIHIHETFLSYLWIISFSLFVIYEEGLAIPSEHQHGVKSYKNQNIKIFNLAKELFQYGKSLIRSYSHWDKNYYPNPEYFDEDTEEGIYILKSNGLFVKAVNFILCHEIGHIALQHIRQAKNRRVHGVDIKPLEKEADDYAIRLILSSDNSKAMEISIFIGLLSLLFFKPNLSGGKEHPDNDERILNYFNYINPNEDHELWALGAVALKLWNDQFDLRLSFTGNYNNYKEYFFYILEQTKKL